MSLVSIAIINRLPTPGYAKTNSTTMRPPNIQPTLLAITVIV
ncbi:uncharacterized protein METZ01_LOCUS205652, partial [marine metagenome]